MSFKLVKRKTFPAKVTTNQQTDKAGVYVQATFTAEFTHIPQSELEEVLQELKDGEITNADVAERYLKSLDEVTDEDGKAVPFEIAKEAIKEDVAACNDLVKAFINGLYGQKVKNSKRSPGR